MSELALNPDETLPLHAQVEKLLRRLAESREYRDGKVFPPEQELADTLGVSRQTVRQAMSRLVQEGLLVRRKKAGTRVAPHRVTTSLLAWRSFSHEMDQRGEAFEALSCQAALVRVGEEVAKFFQIGADEPVVRLNRIKGHDGEPAVLFTSWFHPRIGLTPQCDFTQPLYELLEREFGTVAARSSEEIGARLAGRKLSAMLACRATTPILTRRRRVSDPEGRPVEFADVFYRADRFVYTIDVERGKP